MRTYPLTIRITDSRIDTARSEPDHRLESPVVDYRTEIGAQILTYYPPKYREKQFHCALCGVFASQRWGNLVFGGSGEYSGFQYSQCVHCEKRCFWYAERMIVPSEAPVQPHHPDLPEPCAANYDEARDILSRSPKAAAALMRLCIQKLMKELGQSGQNINDDIAALVQAGLPVEVQQALDYCRVVGNNAVHPGEISIDDNPSIAQSLFEMVNFVVEDRITRPRKIESLYMSLPAGAIEAVQKRDRNNKPQP